MSKHPFYIALYKAIFVNLWTENLHYQTHYILYGSPFIILSDVKLNVSKCKRDTRQSFRFSMKIHYKVHTEIDSLVKMG